MQLRMWRLPLGKLNGRDAQGPDVRLQQQDTVSYTFGGEAVQRNILPRRGKKKSQCASEVLNKILILN